MDLDDNLLYRVREITERLTGRPAYLASDEEWATAVDIVLAEERAKSGQMWISSQNARYVTCPHCGDEAPYGDERHTWISAHLESRLHRWWWKLKAKGL